MKPRQANNVVLGCVSKGTASSPSDGGHVPRRQYCHQSHAFAPLVITSTNSYVTDEFVKAGFSVGELARERGLSVRQFERTFREQFNSCPREMFQKIWTAMAHERLLPDAPLKQIAGELGYKHAADFSRAFRYCYRISPAQMHRKLLKKSREQSGCRILPRKCRKMTDATSGKRRSSHL